MRKDWEYFVLRGTVLMPQSNDNGKGLENVVLLQLNRIKQPSDKITYYQGEKECDFVLQRDESVIQLFQVTWDMTDENTREREVNGILEVSRVTGCDKLFIITKEEECLMEVEGKQIQVLPAWKWLLSSAD